MWALASLAPTRYPELFNYMAASYASKMQHPERLPAHLAAFQSEERAMVLSAFAIVAVVRGEPGSAPCQTRAACHEALLT